MGEANSLKHLNSPVAILSDSTGLGLERQVRKESGAAWSVHRAKTPQGAHLPSFSLSVVNLIS